MDWKQYTIVLEQIQKRFGHYTKQEIDKGFYFWRNKPQSEFVKELSHAITTNQKPILHEPKTFKKPPYFQPIEKPEPRQESQDYMDQMLKQAGASSLVDLIFNKKTLTK